MSGDTWEADTLRRLIEGIQFKQDSLLKLIADTRSDEAPHAISEGEAMNVFEHGYREYAQYSKISPGEVALQLRAIHDAIETLFIVTGRYGGAPVSGSAKGIFNPLVWQELSAIPRMHRTVHSSAGLNRIALAEEREMLSRGMFEEGGPQFEEDRSLQSFRRKRREEMQEPSSAGYLVAALQALSCTDIYALGDRAAELAARHRAARGRKPSVVAEARFTAILAWLFTNLSGRKAAEGRALPGGARFRSPYERFAAAAFTAYGLPAPRPRAIKSGLKLAASLVPTK